MTNENENKMAQKCSKGNTKSFEPNAKFRNFCFTSFTETIPDITDDVRFLAYGIEICPTTNKQHYQAFIIMKNQRSFSGMKKYLKGWLEADVHFEPIKGTIEDNEKYCSKDGSYKEFGSKPKQGLRTDLIDLKDDIMSGKTSADSICIDNPEIYHQYGRTLTKIEDIYMRKQFRTEMTKGIWFYGATGVGKSHIAFENFTPETHYVVPNDNGWWDGYTQQDTIIINDFRGNIPYNEILQLVDKWPHSVRRRCREPMPFTSKTVIITSSLSPEEVFKNRNEKDKIEQLLRRFSVRKLDTPPTMCGLNRGVPSTDAHPPPVGTAAALGGLDMCIIKKKILKRKNVVLILDEVF